jgi:hypothetical protein
MVVITQKQMQAILRCSLVGLFLRGVIKLKDDTRWRFLYVLFRHLEAPAIYMIVKSLSSASISSQGRKHVGTIYKDRKVLKDTFKKLVLSLWHYHWIGVDEGKVNTCRSTLSFSLVSPNLGTRFLLSGVELSHPTFPILGCA